MNDSQKCKDVADFLTRIARLINPFNDWSSMFFIVLAKFILKQLILDTPVGSDTYSRKWQVTKKAFKNENLMIPFVHCSNHSTRDMQT